jgi:hypothetical protein
VLARAAVVGLVAALALVGAKAASPTTRADVAAPPHVTLFGDSVAEGIIDNPPARAIVAKGFDVRFEVAPCRRVGNLSCPFNGVRPPNVIDVVNDVGSALGPTVVVAVGYNDYADQYATNIEDAVSLMEHFGVKRILWLTLHVGHADYQTMNDAILTAAAKHKSLIPVDWNTYSQPHPDWFQSDGIHVDFDGAVGMATLIHTSLQRLVLQPPKKARAPLHVLTKRLPAARRGKLYGAPLAAAGGRRPYYWTLPRKLPGGLRLRPGGWIGGVPRAHAGTFAIVLRGRDAAGGSVTRRFALRIRR